MKKTINEHHKKSKGGIRMGWASRTNNNPDKGKIKPQKPSKAQVDRKIKAAIMGEFIRRMTPKAAEEW